MCSLPSFLLLWHGDNFCGLVFSCNVWYIGVRGVGVLRSPRTIVERNTIHGYLSARCDDQLS